MGQSETTSISELPSLIALSPRSVGKVQVILSEDQDPVLMRPPGQDWFSKGVVTGWRKRSLSVCSEDSSLSLNVQPEATAKATCSFFKQVTQGFRGSCLSITDLCRSLAPMRPKFINYWLDQIPFFRAVSLEDLEQCEGVVYTPPQGNRQPSTIGWIKKEGDFYRTRIIHNPQPQNREVREGKPSFFLGQPDLQASASLTIQLNNQDAEVFESRLKESKYSASEFIQVLRQVGDFLPVPSLSSDPAGKTNCDEKPKWVKIKEGLSWQDLFEANGVRNLNSLKSCRYHPSKFEFKAVVVCDERPGNKLLGAIHHFTVVSRRSGKKEKSVIGQVFKDFDSIAGDYTLKKTRYCCRFAPHEIIAVTGDQWERILENLKTISRRNEVKYSKVQYALYLTANNLKIPPSKTLHASFFGNKGYRNSIPPQSSRVPDKRRNWR